MACYDVATCVFQQLSGCMTCIGSFFYKCYDLFKRCGDDFLTTKENSRYEESIKLIDTSEYDII